MNKLTHPIFSEQMYMLVNSKRLYVPRNADFNLARRRLLVDPIENASIFTGDQTLNHVRSFEVITELAIIIPGTHSGDDSNSLRAVLPDRYSFRHFHQKDSVPLMLEFIEVSFVNRYCLTVDM